MNELERIKRDPVSRRAFLARMGAAGLGLAAISLLEGCGGGSNGGANNGGGGGGTSNLPAALRNLPGRNANEKVLNFALTLELLEADLYRQALNIATGKSPSAALLASPSAYGNSPRIPTGGLDSFNTAAGFAYLRDFAFVEQAHAEFLQSVLNSRGATVANGLQVRRNQGGYRFPPGTDASNLRGILTAILPLEETGVRAYLGAAPFLTDYKTPGGLTQAAVGIYSTEARHSAAIQYVLGNDPGPAPMSGDQRVNPPGTYPSPNTFEYFLTPDQVLTRVTPLFV